MIEQANNIVVPVSEDKGTADNKNRCSSIFKKVRNCICPYYGKNRVLYYIVWVILAIFACLCIYKTFINISFPWDGWHGYRCDDIYEANKEDVILSGWYIPKLNAVFTIILVLVLIITTTRIDKTIKIYKRIGITLRAGCCYFIIIYLLATWFSAVCPMFNISGWRTVNYPISRGAVPSLIYMGPAAIYFAILGTTIHLANIKLDSWSERHPSFSEIFILIKVLIVGLFVCLSICLIPVLAVLFFVSAW